MRIDKVELKETREKSRTVTSIEVCIPRGGDCTSVQGLAPKTFPTIPAAGLGEGKPWLIHKPNTSSICCTSTILANSSPRQSLGAILGNQDLQAKGQQVTSNMYIVIISISSSLDPCTRVNLSAFRLSTYSVLKLSTPSSICRGHCPLVWPRYANS